MLITTRFPVIRVDDYHVAIEIGSPSAEFGDEVSVNAVHDRKTLPSLFVAGVDTSPATKIVREVLEILGVESHEALVLRLERAYGTALPPDVPITIYTLYDRPVEEAL